MARRGINEEKLFQKALDEFIQYSYEKASLNRIISNAGMAKGSFYYRFNNKYELYIFLIKKANKAKWEFIKNETMEDSDIPVNDLIALFLKQAESGVRFAGTYPKYYELSKMLSREKGSPVYQRVLNDLKMNDDSGLEKLIEQTYMSGYFNETFSLEFISRLISSLFFSFDEIFFKNEDFDLEKAMAFLGEFVTFMKCGLIDNHQIIESELN